MRALIVFTGNGSLARHHPMNPKLEPFLIAVVIWLSVALVLAFALAGCTVPLR